MRHVFSHTSRLPGIAEPTTWSDMLDPRVMAKKLERQPPFADPRCALTYHPVTYGWLCGELLRQVDGRTLGRFFAEEIAGPLELEIWFGLPEREEPRVTTLGGDGVWGHVSKNLVVPTDAQCAADPVQTAIWYNPPIFGPDFGKWNARSLHAIEMPGAAAIGTARSIARLYAEVAADGGSLMRPETMRLANQTLSDGWDKMNDERRRFGPGFNLQIEKMQFGPPLDAFGHGGAGGSVHGAWPTEAIGFSYAMNRLIDGDDPRAGRILHALYDALDSTQPQFPSASASRSSSSPPAIWVSSCSLVSALRSNASDTLPRFRISKLSPMSQAWWTLCVMNTMPMPRSRARRTKRSTISDSLTPSADVGSSRISTRAPK